MVYLRVCLPTGMGSAAQIMQSSDGLGSGGFTMNLLIWEDFGSLPLVVKGHAMPKERAL